MQSHTCGPGRFIKAITTYSMFLLDYSRDWGFVHDALYLQADTSYTEYKMSDVKMFDGNKRLQTQVLPIAENTVCIRSLDWDRDRFDIEFAYAPHRRI